MDAQSRDSDANSSGQLDAGREDVRMQIRNGAMLDRPYLIMNILATVLACYGLIADNATAVIGAMVVAQLLGPIMGIALSMVDGDRPLMGQGLFTLVVGVASVLGTAWLIGMLHRDIPPGEQLISRTHPQFTDLMIALAGGAAAAYATVSPRVGTALVGVAVATAMVPPLCTCAIFLGRGDAGEAFQAFLLALTNIVAIQFAASAVLWACGFHRLMRGWKAGYQTLLWNSVSILLLMALGAVLFVHTSGIVAEAIFSAKTSGTLREAIEGHPGMYLAEVRHGKENDRLVVRAVVRGPRPLRAEEVAAIESKLPAVAEGLPVDLRVRFIETTVMTRSGPLWVREP